MNLYSSLSILIFWNLHVVCVDRSTGIAIFIPNSVSPEVMVHTSAIKELAWITIIFYNQNEKLMMNQNKVLLQIAAKHCFCMKYVRATGRTDLETLELDSRVGSVDLHPLPVELIALAAV